MPGRHEHGQHGQQHAPLAEAVGQPADAAGPASAVVTAPIAATAPPSP